MRDNSFPDLNEKVNQIKHLNTEEGLRLDTLVKEHVASGIDVNRVAKLLDLVIDKEQSLNTESRKYEHEREVRQKEDLEKLNFSKKRDSLSGYYELPDFPGVLWVSQNRLAFKVGEEDFVFINPFEVEFEKSPDVPEHWKPLQTDGGRYYLRPFDHPPLIDQVTVGVASTSRDSYDFYVQSGTLRAYLNETSMGSFIHKGIIQVDIERVPEEGQLVFVPGSTQGRNSKIANNDARRRIKLILEQIRRSGYPVVVSVPSDERRSRLYQRVGMKPLNEDILVGVIDQML